MTERRTPYLGGCSCPKTAWQALQGQQVRISWLDPTIDAGTEYQVLVADAEFVLLKTASGERLCVRLADIDHGRTGHE